MVPDPGEGGQSLLGDRVEQLARIADAQREAPPDGKVELSILASRHLAVHVLHLRFQHLAVDEGARVGLRQLLRQRHLLFPGRCLIGAHRNLLLGEWRRRTSCAQL